MEVSTTPTDPCLGPSMTIDCMSQRLEGMPEPMRLFRGIIQPSLGCFFGPSKSGKTTLVENLAMSIASGCTDFLGDQLQCDNRRVLLVSLEEYYRSRTIRNRRQMDAYTNLYNPNPGWRDNVFVIDESFPRYFSIDAHWALLEKEIERVNPSIVMLDSLSRLTVDPIEDSTTAAKIMKRLRELTHKHGIALILIHHSQKMENRPITIASLAGSRIIGQEQDFMIGVNKSTLNVRYLKDVAYRYHPDDAEQVMKFAITPHQMIESLGMAYEHEILTSAASNQAINESDSLVVNQLLELSGNDSSVIVNTADLYSRLVDTRITTKPTLHAALKRLEKEGIIEKPEKGQYRLVTPS